MDPGANSVADAHIIGQRMEVTLSELMEMGFPWEQIENLDNLDGASEQEQFNRIMYDDDRQALDPASREVLLTEAYMAVDAEGTGIAQPYKFLMGGTNYKLLSYEPWDDVPFINFCADPIPHAFFGQSIADVLFNEQDSSTVILRGVLDNTALVNNPRIQIMDGACNVSDLLKQRDRRHSPGQEPGRHQAAYSAFGAADTLNALQYLDRTARTRRASRRPPTASIRTR